MVTRVGQQLRVDFLLKTDSGYPKDTRVNKPWQPLVDSLLNRDIDEFRLLCGKHLKKKDSVISVETCRGKRRENGRNVTSFRKASVASDMGWL